MGLPHVRKNGVPFPHQLDGVSPVSWMGYTPPPPIRRLDSGSPSSKVGQKHARENITSRHPSDANGNKDINLLADLELTS